MTAKNLSLKEIATLLGVSPSTVSLVLHDRPGVKPSTREKVVQTLRSYGYLDDPSPASVKHIRLLKYTTTSYQVEDYDGFASAMIDGVCDEAKQYGFNVAISTCREGQLKNALDIINAESPSGFIILGTDIPLVYENYFQGARIPMVLVDTHMPLCEVDNVVFDSRVGIYMVLQHLCDLGHRQIGYIHSAFQTANSIERLEAFYNAMRHMGLAVDSRAVVALNPTFENVYHNAISILRTAGAMPTAFVTDNDTIAMGCLRALRSNGYTVPGDVSVAGFGGNAFCRITEPPLTTFRIPAEYMGRYAVWLLNARILNPQCPISRLKLRGELICRESTARTNLSKR